MGSTMPECTCRVTITGVDSGGYVFENVLTINGTFSTEAMYQIAQTLGDYLADPFLVTYVEAFPNVVKILTLSVVTLLPDPGITFIQAVNEFGGRDVMQASGTLALGFQLVPNDGVPPVGHQYVPCLGDGDVEADVIVVDPTFTALAAAYAAIDGTAPTYAWQLAVWNKETKTGRPVFHATQMVKPVVLSKRQRA